MLSRERCLNSFPLTIIKAEGETKIKSELNSILPDDVVSSYQRRQAENPKGDQRGSKRSVHHKPGYDNHATSPSCELKSITSRHIEPFYNEGVSRDYLGEKTQRQERRSNSVNCTIY